MNAQAYNQIIETIAPLLESRGYHAVDEEDGSYFTDGKAAVRVNYDDGREMFNLEQTGVENDQPAGEWKTLSAWLFAQDAPLKDVRSIASDFEDSLREFLGVKPTLQKNTAAAIPSRGNPGDDPTPATLAGRFLTVFPQFKGDYDRYVTDKGTFLYVHFFEEVAAPHVGALLDADDKKRLEKLFEMLNQVYCNGTKEARSVVAAVVLAGALRGQPARMETADRYMEEYPFLKTAAHYAAKVKPAKA